MIRRHTWRGQLPLALVVLVSALEGCGATDVCACGFGTATAVIFGRVTSPEGTGVPGARVRVEARVAPDCPAIGVDGDATTQSGGVFQSAGLFRLEVGAFEEAAGVCLAVQALPPSDSTELSASAVAHVVVDLAFTSEPDSLEVPLTLTR
jgi:hypothetical protein